MVQILTHRGLEPNKKKFYAESSFEAFRDHLQRGFGVEFDINFSKDNKIIIFHDNNLSRLTNKADIRQFKNLSIKQINKIKIKGNKICSFQDLIKLIIKHGAGINALHLKGKFQNKNRLNILIKELKKYQKYLNKIIIFDIKISTAIYLKKFIPELILAPSVAHKYDIKRYGKCVDNTLISIEQAIKNKKIFDWVWLDEWDKISEKGTKKFYIAKNFKMLKNAGFKIALVTPELHATSPNLLGAESHQDAINKKVLFKRIKQIINLKPNAICTDYPDLLGRLTLS
ncbi:MAG: glycerophosphodiester phosphodiesterase family protein [bacterium]|nr:glycerophosphodiester phosphodiesterase family protein [bacterium]